MVSVCSDGGGSEKPTQGAGEPDILNVQPRAGVKPVIIAPAKIGFWPLMVILAASVDTVIPELTVPMPPWGHLKVAPSVRIGEGMRPSPNRLPVCRWRAGR